ncbi:MAG: hypothetical protein C3F11_07330 [Methylocystaceae bacterium]|nr:MAG: hypothetical protein C3F11_07330 [Methylocystaceae bacterium]
MGIGADQLTLIDAFLETAAADHAAVSGLRRLAPGLTATRCDTTDVRDETPFRSYAKVDLFLLDGRDHCVKITSDPSVATGVILAPRGEGA